MKLDHKTRFQAFRAPGLGIDLGAGRVTFADKYNFAVSEDAHPDTTFMIPSAYTAWVMELHVVTDKRIIDALLQRRR